MVVLDKCPMGEVGGGVGVVEGGLGWVEAAQAPTHLDAVVSRRSHYSGHCFGP